MSLIDSVSSYLGFDSIALDDGANPGAVGSGTSFFGREAALAQAQAFSNFSDRAWGTIDGIRSDASLPHEVRDIASLSQPFMAVGLGALGLANDVATVVRDPSLLVEPLLDPGAAAKQVGQGISDFFSNPNPFRQSQSLITNFADPAMAGVHVAGELGRLSTGALDMSKSFAHGVGESMTRLYDKGQLHAFDSFMPGSSALFPSFSSALYAVPPTHSPNAAKVPHGVDLFDDIPVVNWDDIGGIVSTQGTRKVVYEFGDKVIGVSRSLDFNHHVLEESSILGELRDRDVRPVVDSELIQVVKDDGVHLGLIYPRFAFNTKSFSQYLPLHTNGYHFDTHPYFNQQTLSDVKEQRRTLNEAGLAIGDLQGLVGRDGRAVLADPSAMVNVRDPSADYRRQVLEDNGLALGRIAQIQDDYFDAFVSAIEESIRRNGP